MINIIKTAKSTFFRLWYWNRSTKIKLYHVESIGVDQGYFECGNEFQAIKAQHWKDVEVMPVEEANRLLDERFARMMRRYFGPKYIKA